MQQQHRLKQNRQFSYVYRRGVRASGRNLSVLYVRNQRKQVGFSVSKKVGVAVVRNRTKRRLRECIRPQLPQMRNGLYVFVARPSAAMCTLEQLRAETESLLRKLSQPDKPRRSPS